VPFKPVLYTVAVSAGLVLLGYLHHTKIPPAGALLDLAPEVLMLFSGFAFRR